jgi:ferredoxin-NADP reductase
MSERGARPKVPTVQRRILRMVSAFTSPLLPDDYLELINPLWSTRELRGRIESIDRETHEAVTVTIRPGYEWPGHQPGQYLRIGFDIDGVRHWRAYSITSDSDREDGFISITPKLVESGVVSPYLVNKARVGTIVSLSDVEGEFILPEPLPEKLLFISAGSGVTPIMSMLRSLERMDALGDVVHLHSTRKPDEFIFGDYLHRLRDSHEGFRLHEQVSAEDGRLEPGHLDELCPDWREREAYLSGPAELLDAMDEHWEREGNCEQLHIERFQMVLDADNAGEGGTVWFAVSEQEAESDGDKPILVAGEEAGLDLPFGCREGVCHTCVGELCSGQVRDLRTGDVYGQEGEMIRTCISAPEGEIEIKL